MKCSVSVLYTCSPKNKLRGFEEICHTGSCLYYRPRPSALWACNDVSTRRSLFDFFLTGRGFISLFFFNFSQRVPIKIERIHSLERKKKHIYPLITFIFIFCNYLSNPKHVCSFYIYICTFFLKQKTVH